MLSHRVSFVLAALFVLACSSSMDDANSGNPGKPRANKREVVCPSIYIEPHAIIDLGEGEMRTNGKYSLEYEADGQRESCEFEVSNIGPQTEECVGKECVVQSPTTRSTTTCKMVDVAGIGGDGSLGTLATLGTPKHVSLTLSRDGKTLVSGSADPDYTPDECGFVKPTVKLTKP